MNKNPKIRFKHPNGAEYPDWQVKRLEDVCKKIFAGGDISKDRFSKEKTTAFNIPIFANGVVEYGLQGYTDIATVSEPAITISARGTIGYCVARYSPFYPAVRLIVCIPNTKLIILEYLKIIIDIIDIDETGQVQKQLTSPATKTIKIRLPHPEEQKRIAEFLSNLDDMIKGFEQKVDNLQQQKKYYMQNMFI